MLGVLSEEVLGVYGSISLLMKAVFTGSLMDRHGEEMKLGEVLKAEAL
jgi:hypothetical protein